MEIFIACVFISFVINAYIVHHLTKKNGKLYSSLIIMAIVPFIGTVLLLLANAITNDIDEIFDKLNKN